MSGLSEEQRWLVDELRDIINLVVQAERDRCAKIAEAHDRDGRSNWGAVIAKDIRSPRPTDGEAT